MRALLFRNNPPGAVFLYRRVKLLLLEPFADGSPGRFCRAAGALCFQRGQDERLQPGTGRFTVRELRAEFVAMQDKGVIMRNAIAQTVAEAIRFFRREAGKG